MAKEVIDAYLEALPEPKQSTLPALRQLIVETVPEAEQCISYGMPAGYEERLLPGSPPSSIT